MFVNNHHSVSNPVVVTNPVPREEVGSSSTTAIFHLTRTIHAVKRASSIYPPFSYLPFSRPILHLHNLHLFTSLPPRFVFADKILRNAKEFYQNKELVAANFTVATLRHIHNIQCLSLCPRHLSESTTTLRFTSSTKNSLRLHLWSIASASLKSSWLQCVRQHLLHRRPSAPQQRRALGSTTTTNHIHLASRPESSKHALRKHLLHNHSILITCLHVRHASALPSTAHPTTLPRQHHHRPQPRRRHHATQL